MCTISMHRLTPFLGIYFSFIIRFTVKIEILETKIGSARGYDGRKWTTSDFRLYSQECCKSRYDPLPTVLRLVR